MAVRSALRAGHPLPPGRFQREGVEIARKHGIAAILLFGHVVVVVVVFLIFIPFCPLFCCSDVPFLSGNYSSNDVRRGYES
jgi:hypothetical protein